VSTVKMCWSDISSRYMAVDALMLANKVLPWQPADHTGSIHTCTLHDPDVSILGCCGWRCYTGVVNPA
jgi:hypothetical protein